MPHNRKNSKKRKKNNKKNLKKDFWFLLTSFLSAVFTKKVHKAIRYAFALIALVLTWYWTGYEKYQPPIPSGDMPALLYSNQCDDDLRSLFLSAIHEAKDSIFLIIYSLSDPKIIQALKSKADEGIRVTVVHDPKTSQNGFEKLGSKVQQTPKFSKGLMHMKILVIDEKKLWIGSANMTKESLIFHDNLVVGLESPALAKMIMSRQQARPKDFLVGGQHIEFYFLPEDKAEGVKKLQGLIRSAKKTIRVAMFTWTHPDLTESIIAASRQGVNVEVVMDYGQSQGVNEESLKKLIQAGIIVKTNQSDVLHHKFLYIDDAILVNGSANWTRAAFSKNDDCFLVIHNLTEEQNKKMQALWHAIRATSKVATDTLKEKIPLLADAA